jgi:divalent metal cation (Fe/Co/Zn/Cd) transporter
MQQMIFIADLIACSTCFRHHYGHHQEIESIIQMVAACGIWCFGFQVALSSSPQTGQTTLSSTPYRKLENQSTKYHRQQPSV